MAGIELGIKVGGVVLGEGIEKGITFLGKTVGAKIPAAVAQIGGDLGAMMIEKKVEEKINNKRRRRFW